MADIKLPLSITYYTAGTTPVADVVASLQAADQIIQDALSLLPSLIPGVNVQDGQVSVRALTQESPLREMLVVAFAMTFQPELQGAVPPMLEALFDITIDDRFDSLVTVIFLIVVFHAGALAVNTARGAMTDSLPRKKCEEMIDLLARETGSPAADIRKIVESSFMQPAAFKRLLRSVRDLFRPSQAAGNVPVDFDRDRIPTATIREIPLPGEADSDTDLSRYEPFQRRLLDIHAMDRDRHATGWAAVVQGVSDKRLRVKIMDPATPAELWGRPTVVADGVIVLKLTSDGFVPTEVHVTAVHGDAPLGGQSG